MVGTHPGMYNGYALVMNALASRIPKDWELLIYGVQNVGNPVRNTSHLPIHDAMATEEPRRMGFGEQEFPDFIKNNERFDVMFTLNDPYIATRYTNGLKGVPEEKRPKKVVVYIDQVYEYQKPELVELLNKDTDAICYFSEHWKNFAENVLKITRPGYVIHHGYEPKETFPMDKQICKQVGGLRSDAIVVLNFNRNTGRKRYDIAAQAYAIVADRAEKEGVPYQFLIGTDATGSWDIRQIFEFELRALNYTPEQATEMFKKYFVFVSRPQKLTDDECNVLYNASDIGLNTCDGEGWGLTGFQSSILGVPTVIPNFGSMRVWASPDSAELIEPAISVWEQPKHSVIAGKTYLCNPKDIAEGIWRLGSNPELRKAKGEKAALLTRKMTWDAAGKQFVEAMEEIYKN